METPMIQVHIANYISLKPTYEGWKHISSRDTWNQILGLKPTYEGWKLPLNNLI
ncbi:hypothetical protein MTY_1542 [Moorella thermoacetica Y72]|uniref:Uncharacterized protein n=1 Tax=Moorella thermoacetica Y72 TaxID=1325331 RepID=A0A0S6UGU1_NEOTH|nr:hypothetical protein MTY_1542 [Moorella thermoacetica Y72]